MLEAENKISPQKPRQQTPAANEHQPLRREQSFFTSEKRDLIFLAAKTTVAAGLTYYVARLVGLQDGYWGAISSIIVTQSNVGATVAASRDRLIGTIIGAAYGGVFAFAALGFWAYLVALVAAMATCSLLGLKNSSRLAGVTVTIILLVHPAGSSWILPLHRVLEVLLGIVVALAISALDIPGRAIARLLHLTGTETDRTLR